MSDIFFVYSKKPPLFGRHKINTLRFSASRVCICASATPTPKTKHCKIASNRETDYNMRGFSATSSVR